MAGDVMDRHAVTAPDRVRIASDRRSGMVEGEETGQGEIGPQTGTEALASAVPGVPHVVDVLARELLALHAIQSAALAATESALTTLRLVQVQREQVQEIQRGTAAERLRDASVPRVPPTFGASRQD
jgi:hypothetical protein